MKDFRFAEASTPILPRHSRPMYVVAALVHLVFLAVLIHVKAQPPHVSTAGSPFGSMTAYVSGATVGAPAPTTPAPKVAAAKRNALATKTARAVPPDAAASAGAVGGAGVGQAGGGPVRLGSGGALTLLKKVQPIYPPLMQSARQTGQVVLDAIIHPDGTIGDIAVLRSTNDAFAQSAVDAVRQWRYSAPGFEGILTVSVNFTLNA